MPPYKYLRHVMKITCTIPLLIGWKMKCTPETGVGNQDHVKEAMHHYKILLSDAR
jgi:hypothetical protein